MKWSNFLICAALASAALPRANSEPLYDITTIGLQGVEHTRDDGYLFSAAQEMNAVGQVVGYAERYNGGGINLGRSLWMYDGLAVHHIGLIDAEHTAGNGLRRSSIAEPTNSYTPFHVPRPDLPDVQLNEAGFVAGHSERFNGGSSLLGQSAWLFNGSTTEKVGLTDAEHTGLNSSKDSTIVLINRRGRALDTRAGIALPTLVARPTVPVLGITTVQRRTRLASPILSTHATTVIKKVQ